MTNFNISEIHSIGMYALTAALDKIIHDKDDELGHEFRELLLEVFELNLYRCLVHTCPEHTISVTVDNVPPAKKLLLD